MSNLSIVTARYLRKHFPELDKTAAERVECLSRRGDHSDAIKFFNDALGVKNGFFGAEYIGVNADLLEISRRPYADTPIIEYANTGDSYGKTLTYSWIDHCYRVTSWGDLIEFYERKGIHFE